MPPPKSDPPLEPEREPEDDIVKIREHADKVLARRAAARAAGKADAGDAGDESDSKKKKKPRAWWSYLIDVALFAAAAYMIKVRFFTKEPEAPAPAPAASQSASVATAAPSILTKAASEMRAGPGYHFGTVEALTAKTSVEVLEAPAAGWVKVKVPSGKTGFVPVETISVPPIARASATASASP
jgi:hypothetical protein